MPFNEQIGSDCGLSELAFALDRCLDKFKISNSRFATILSERSIKDGVTTSPGRSLIGLWRQGNRLIVAKHHEGLKLWLAEMKEDEEEEEDEEEDEEDEEEGGEEEEEGSEEEEEEVAEKLGDFSSEGEEDEEEDEEALETHKEKRQRIAAASPQQAPSN